VPLTASSIRLGGVFEDDYLGRAPIHSGDFIQALDRFSERGHDLLDLLADRLDRHSLAVEMGENVADQEGMVRPKPSSQGGTQRRQVGSMSAFGQFGQDVGGHRGVFDPAVLEHLIF